MGDIRVLWVDLTGFPSDTEQRLYTQATPERAAKAQCYGQAADRLRCLAAGALLETALDRVGIPSEARQFDVTKHGKPILCGDWAERFHYNISHSGNIVLCAYGPSPVGADVEQPDRAIPRIVEKKCSPGEWAWLQTQEDQNAAFFRLWVLKEAYVKALGIGLSLGLSQYEVHLGERVYVDEHWQFSEATLNGYPAAVCSTLPCVWEQLSPAELLNRSCQ